MSCAVKVMPYREAYFARHCERSEQSRVAANATRSVLDCFVASLLAMTGHHEPAARHHPGAWTVFAPLRLAAGVDLLVCPQSDRAAELCWGSARCKRNRTHAWRYTLAAFASPSGSPITSGGTGAALTARRDRRCSCATSTGSSRRSRSLPAGALPAPRLVFLDRGADRAGLHRAGADRRSGLRVVLGILGLSHTVIAACAAYDVAVRGFVRLARSRHRGAASRDLSWR